MSQAQQISNKQFAGLNAQARALQELMQCHEQIEHLSEQLNEFQQLFGQVAAKLKTPADAQAVLAKLDTLLAEKPAAPTPPNAE